MTSSPVSYKKSSFGPAFLFLDPKRRKALAVYYAFCRLADDIADEEYITDKMEQLDFWKQEIARVYAQQPTTDLGRDLVWLVTQFNIPKDRFELLLDGMRADVQKRTYESWDDLQWYLWRVAGIVGLATLDILGVKGPQAERLASTLGTAVQLTNIIRDVQEDARLGRVYLPQQWLQQHGLTRDDILSFRQAKELAALLREAAQTAKQYYGQAQQIMKGLPSRKMLPCQIMGFVYQKNLAKIEKTDFQFTGAIKLTKTEKITACVYAIYKTFITR